MFKRAICWRWRFLTAKLSRSELGLPSPHVFQMWEPAVGLAGVLISSITLYDQFGGEKNQRVPTQSGRTLAELVSSAAGLKPAVFQISPSRNNEKQKCRGFCEGVFWTKLHNHYSIAPAISFSLSFLENASRAVKDLCEREGFCAELDCPIFMNAF